MSARSFAFLTLLGTVTLVTCALFAAVVYRQIYRERVYPGVHVASVGGPIDLGGQTRDEATQTLVVQSERFLRAPISLRYLGREWHGTPREMGAHVDVGATVDRALTIGREKDLWTRVGSQAAGLSGTITIEPPRVAVDTDKLSAFVTELSHGIDRTPTSADLALKPEGGVMVLASQTGRRLNVARTTEQIATALNDYSTAPVALVVDAVPPVLAEGDLADVKAQADRVIGASLMLVAELPGETKRWTLDRGEIVDLLELKTTRTSPPRYELRVEENRVRQLVERIAPEIERPARNARYSLANGPLAVLRPSEEGRRLEVTASINAIRAALGSDDRTVRLPWQRVRPAFASDDVGKVWFPHLVERATTQYGRTLPERMHNVELAASRINGVVVPPGDTFSFNDEVGEVSYRSGYQRGYGITQEGEDVVTIPSEGGGICQVATTLFQSVFWGGYQVVERNWHLYWIPRYGQRPRGLKGLDATIDQVYDRDGKLLYAVDLRWRNNSEAPVLVVASTDGDTLTVALWGRKPLWQVKVAEPKVDQLVKADPRTVRQHDASLATGVDLMIERAEDGFRSTIVRGILIDGRLVEETRFVSTYRPSRNVFLYGGPVAKGTAVPGRASEDRPATPASVATQPPSVITPYAPPETPTRAGTPSPRGTGAPAPTTTRTGTPAARATPTR